MGASAALVPVQPRLPRPARGFDCLKPPRPVPASPGTPQLQIQAPAPGELASSRLRKPWVQNESCSPRELPPRAAVRTEFAPQTPVDSSVKHREGMGAAELRQCLSSPTNE